MAVGRFRGGQLNPLNQLNPNTITTSPLRLLNPFFVLRRNALFRGLFGGDKTWLIVGAIVWAPVLLRRAVGRRPERVAFEQLAIGHVLRLEVLPQDTKLEREVYRRTR
jgi:hypothetical protein